MMLFTLFLISVLIPPGVSGKLTEELIQRLQSASSDEMISCIVVMKGQYPYEAMESYPIVERIKTYRNIAETSQQPVIDWLSTIPEARVHQRYWVLNGFHLEAKPEVILAVAKRDDVAWVNYNSEVRLIEPIKSEHIPSGRPIEWNILRVQADSCWRAGFTGEGVIIGLVGTGVDYNHPALAGKWAGYWHVAQGLPPSTTPYDDHGSGTHRMGIILGGDGLGPFTEDIGVAPGARYVASKVSDRDELVSWARFIEGYQWIADLKSTVDIKAVLGFFVISKFDTTGFPICRTLISIGVLPIFGNGYYTVPDTGTVVAPAVYSNVIGVGATTNEGDTVLYFSARGPSPNQAPYNDPNTWLRSDWNFIKPNISAPGQGIRSCSVGGGYATRGGTGAAAAHLVGAVAIMCQKNPLLSPRTIYSILIDNADRRSGITYPNNHYGWGRLNVWRALQQTPPPPPHHNIRVEYIEVPDVREREYTVIQPRIRFRNMGTYDETNIPVVCRIMRGATQVYSSNRTIGSLLRNRDTLITFDNFTVGVCGNHYQAIGISNLPLDSIRRDDTLRKDFVAARLYEVISPNCNAWKIANADSGMPPPPPHPSWIPATTTEKQQISALDNQWWVTAGSPQDSVRQDLQLYGFRLTGVPDTAIKELVLEWWGHHGSGVRNQLLFRVFDTWFLKYSLKRWAEDVTSDQVFSIIIPDDSAEVYVGNDEFFYACVANCVGTSSSCPLLFTHNKDKSYFIGDIITGGDIGTWIGQVMGINIYAPPDYDEYVKIDGGKLKPVNGRYHLSINEMLQEISYIDEVRLYVVDHPMEYGIYPNEALLWPGYQGLKIFCGPNQPILRALNDNGEDITDCLKEIDRNFVPFGNTGIEGFAQPFTITFDLGELAEPNKAVLCLYGSTRFPDAGEIKEVSDIYEAYKKGMKVQNPVVEVYNNGKWQKIKSCGMPAGYNKLVTYPLYDEDGRSIFKGNEHKIRITFYHEVYLDKAWVTTNTANNYRIVELTPNLADLRYYGYSAYVSEDGRYPGEFDYASKVEIDYAQAAGYYTRYGDVMPLLQKGDNRFVIMKSGDEIKLEFDADELPLLPDGWTRSFIFATKGFYKAIRPGRAYAYSVDPLPFYGMRKDLSANGVGYYPYDPAPGLFGSLAGRIYAKIVWGYPFSFKDAFTLIKDHIMGRIKNQYPAELTEYCQAWNTRRVEGYYPAYYAHLLPHKNLEKVPLTEREGKWPMHLASLGIPFGPHSLYSNYVRLWMVTRSPLGVVEERPANQAIGFSFIVLENPFRNTARLEYHLPINSKVNLSVYDNTGRLVRRLVDARQDRGSYQIEWSGDDEKGRRLPAGVYFVRYETDQTNSVEKVIMLR